MKVHELMTKDPAVVAPDQRLGAAIDLMAGRGVRHLPVVERKKLVGVISERDLLEATGWMPERYADADGPKVVRDAMSVHVETVAADDDVEGAIATLLERRIGCLPVVDPADRLEGLVTVGGLLAAHVRACAAAPSMGALDAVVASRMSENLVTLDARDTVAEALEACRRHEVRHLPVESDGWFVGIVSDRDLRLRIGRGEVERPLGEIMSTDLATVGIESLLSDASEIMQRRRVGSVAVTRDGKLLGMLTTTDVLRLLSEKLAAEPEALRVESR